MVQIATKEGPRRIPRSEEREWRMSITQNEGMLRKPEWKGALCRGWRIMNETGFGYVFCGLRPHSPPGIMDHLLLLGSWTTFSSWNHGPPSPPGKSGDTSASPTELLHGMKNTGNCSCSLSSHFKTFYYFLCVYMCVWR